jgi:hypothetical protein
VDEEEDGRVEEEEETPGFDKQMAAIDNGKTENSR